VERVDSNQTCQRCLSADVNKQFHHCVKMHCVVTGTTPEYILDMVTPESEFEGRAHPHSATLGLYDVPRTRTLMGFKAFSVAGPTA